MRRRITLGLGLLAFCAMAALWILDLVPDPVVVGVRLREAGPIGGLIFVLAFMGLQPWGLPGSLFVVPAALVWSPGVAFALSWTGANLASLVGFLFARWAGREWARGRLGPWLETYDRRLVEHGFATVVALRMLFVSAPPTSWLLGVSGIPLRTFMVASGVGFVPGIALITLLGNRGLAAAREPSPTALIVLLGALGAFLLYQRRVRAVLVRSLHEPVNDIQEGETT
jgi:uncharacterized membrane protein YdjX (TVP38/TMEM64 family)